MAGFDPNQPRDEKGQWAAGAVRMAHALRQQNLRLRNFSAPEQPLQYSLSANIITVPVRSARASERKLEPASVALSLGHEVGHHLSGMPLMRAAFYGPRLTRIEAERIAWAKGLRWLRNQGYRPKLDLLKRMLGRTLGTYATGGQLNVLAATGNIRQRLRLGGPGPHDRLTIRASSYNSHHRLLRMK